MKRLGLLVFTTLIVSVVFVQPVQAKPVQLRNFSELFEAFKAGNTVKAVFYYKGCKLVMGEKVVPPEKVPDAIGGMEMSTFEYFAPMSIGNKKGYISSSKTVLINHPRYGYVLNYAKVRIYDDNSIQIIAQYVSPTTYEIKMDEAFYTEINDGKNKGAAYFYLK